MYDNDPFSLNARSSLNSESWHALTFLAEAVQGIDSLAPFQNCVSIFGASRAEPESPAYNDARAVAKLLAENGYNVITGGGPGLMEAGNRGAVEGGGASIGLHIYLPHEQRVNDYVQTRVNFHNFFIRKLMFVKYAVAYVVMPGGLGTLDELTDAAVLSQTGRMRPIPIVLYNSEFWGGMIDWLRGAMVRDGYIREDELSLLTLLDNPNDVLGHLRRHAPL
jgi:uncharacterized protein (TIGR00730 family)